MLRRTSFAELDVTNAAKLGRIPGLAATSGRCRPSAGDVNLKIRKLRRQTFETAIIERCRRRESSVEEALEDITEALRQLRFGTAAGSACSHFAGHAPPD